MHIGNYIYYNYSKFASAVANLSVEQRAELTKEAEETFKDIVEDEMNDLIQEAEYGYRYGIPECFCPICTMTHIPAKNMLSYLLKKSNHSKDTISQEMRESFKTYEDFKNFIK